MMTKAQVVLRRDKESSTLSVDGVGPLLKFFNKAKDASTRIGPIAIFLTKVHATRPSKT